MAIKVAISTECMPLSNICQSGLREGHQSDEIVDQKKRKSSTTTVSVPPSKRMREEMTENSFDQQRKTSFGNPNNGFSRNASHLTHSKASSVKKLVIKNLKGACY